MVLSFAAKLKSPKYDIRNYLEHPSMPEFSDDD